MIMMKCAYKLIIISISSSIIIIFIISLFIILSFITSKSVLFCFFIYILSLFQALWACSVNGKGFFVVVVVVFARVLYKLTLHHIVIIIVVVILYFTLLSSSPSPSPLSSLRPLSSSTSKNLISSYLPDLLCVSVCVVCACVWMRVRGR